MRKALAPVALAGLLLLALTGCGEAEPTGLEACIELLVEGLGAPEADAIDTCIKGREEDPERFLEVYG